MRIGSTSNEDMLFTIQEDNDEGVEDSSEEESEGGSEDGDETETDYTTLPTSEIMIMIRNRRTGEDEMFRVLLDSGTSRSLATETAIDRAGLRKKKNRKEHRYRTAAGLFKTTQQATIREH